MPEIRVQGRLPSHAMAGFPQDSAPGPNATLNDLAAWDARSGGGSTIMQAWMSQHTAANMSRGTGQGRGFGAVPGGAVDFSRGTVSMQDLPRIIAAGLATTPPTGVQFGSMLYYERDIDQQGAALRGIARAGISASVSGAALGRIPMGGGGGIDIPTPPGGWASGPMRPAWGMPAFLRNAIGGGGGGAGGAGGGGGGAGGAGGGGGGGGMGGGGGIPFAGMIGLGVTSRILTGGLIAGAAVAVAEETAFLPQSFGGMEASALANSEAYRRLVYGTFALGRAGGFSGSGLLGDVYRGIDPPDWMKRLGLGPTEAMRTLSGFGIVQRGGGGNVPLIQGLAGMQFNPAFSGMDQGAVQGSVAQAARYGMVGGNAAGVQQYTQQLAPVLTTAVEQGLDRAAILRSIDAGVAMTARGGGFGATPGSLGRFLMQYSDLPGGRTGEAGLSSLENFRAAGATVGSDPLRTQVFMSAAQRLNTPAKLNSFLDRFSGGYSQSLASNPVSSAMVADYFAALRAGNLPAAAQYLERITTGNPDAYRDIFANNQAVNQLPLYMRDLNRLGGQTTEQNIAGRMGARRTLGDRSNNPLNLMSGQGGTIGVYPSMQAGIAADVGQLRINRDRYGLNTLRGQIARWAPASAGNDTIGYTARVAQRLGIGQDAPLSLDDPDFMARLVQAMAQEEVGHGLSGADVSGGIQQAMGRSPSLWRGADTRELGVMRDRTGASVGGNMPFDALGAQGAALAGAMKGSEISFSEMNELIPKINKGLADLAAAAGNAAKELNNAAKELNKIGAGASTFATPP